MQQVGGEVCLLELSVARVGEHDGKVCIHSTDDDDDDDNDNGDGDDDHDDVADEDNVADDDDIQQPPELENTM